MGQGGADFAHYDAADHNEDTGLFGLADEEPQGFCPDSALFASSDIETERLANPGCCGFRRRLDCCASNEWKLLFAFGLREISIPFLPLPAEVNHVEQVRTWSPDSLAGKGAEIRDRERFHRRFLEEQIT